MRSAWLDPPPPRKRSATREDLHFLGGVFLGAPLAALLMLGTACPPKSADVPPPTVDVARAQGDCVAYRIKTQLGCVVDNRTKAEIDACRAGVEMAVDCRDGGWTAFLPRVGDGGAE